MKNTKEDEKKEQNKKINFQSLRKCFFANYCDINIGKCNSYLLYDEFV